MISVLNILFMTLLGLAGLYCLLRASKCFYLMAEKKFKAWLDKQDEAWLARELKRIKQKSFHSYSYEDRVRILYAKKMRARPEEIRFRGNKLEP